MPWKRLARGKHPQRRRSRPYLDESVPVSVQHLLAGAGYHIQTARQRHMGGRSDEDQAALCWREDRTLLTFDYDFLNPNKLPNSRNPGVIILDCDRKEAAQVAATVFAFSEFEHLAGAVTRRTRVIILGDGQVSVWTTANSGQPPDFRYLLRADKPPMIWQN